MLGGENEFKSTGNCRQISSCFLRCMGCVIVQYQPNLVTLGVLIIEELQEFDEVRTLMCFPYERNSFTGA